MSIIDRILCDPLTFPDNIYLGKICLNSKGWWIAKKEGDILYWSWIRKNK